jgi:dihydroorotase
LPAFVDLHVHLREPGYSYKETIATGTAAALQGGYGALVAMPNTNPPPDCPAHLHTLLDLLPDAAVAVYPTGCISKNRAGLECADAAALAPYVCGFSDDGSGIQDDGLMRDAMQASKQLGKPIVAHCEDARLLHGGYIHAGSYAQAHNHKGISSESEWRQIERDLSLIAETHCAYHICHVSTKEGVSLVRQAKASGLPVSCETAPHYLLLTQDDLQEDGRFKMNPPLREKSDRAALLAGLLDGTIDAIATDHAPHSAAEKSKGLAGSAFGIAGLETAFPLLYTYLVKPGILPFEILVDRLSARPAALLEQWTQTNVPRFRFLSENLGSNLFDLETEYTIDPTKFASKGKSTPFAGWHVFGKRIA